MRKLINTIENKKPASIWAGFLFLYEPAGLATTRQALFIIYISLLL